MSDASPPRPERLPYGRQQIDDDDVRAVVEALRSDWLTCGPAVERFEEALAAACGARHAVAVNSGTAALHLALKAVGVGPGDRVLTSANTFLASANAAEYLGATADFADVDPATRCVSVGTLEAAWRGDVKAVVAVDFAGYPCATPEMAAFVHGRGAALVEDACHSLGGALGGYPVGGLPWVDAATFSFHPVKTLTTAEGGAVLTGRGEWAAACRLFRNHGMARPGPGEDEDARPYAMETPGYNYRITDLQCALGHSQLGKLRRFVARRREIVAAYDEAFAGWAHVRTPPRAGPGVEPAWHIYALQIDFEALGTTRAALRRALEEEGVGTQIHYYPVHLQPYYAKRYGYAPGKCPAAETWFRQALSLPLHPGLTDDDVRRVADALRRRLPGG
jgi:perosamine synthetase